MRKVSLMPQLTYVTFQVKTSIVCTSNFGNLIIYKICHIGKTQKFQIHSTDQVNLTLLSLQI